MVAALLLSILVSFFSLCLSSGCESDHAQCSFNSRCCARYKDGVRIHGLCVNCTDCQQTSCLTFSDCFPQETRETSPDACTTKCLDYRDCKTWYVCRNNSCHKTKKDNGTVSRIAWFGWSIVIAVGVVCPSFLVCGIVLRILREKWKKSRQNGREASSRNDSTNTNSEALYRDGSNEGIYPQQNSMIFLNIEPQIVPNGEYTNRANSISIMSLYRDPPPCYSEVCDLPAEEPPPSYEVTTMGYSENE